MSQNSMNLFHTANILCHIFTLFVHLVLFFFLFLLLSSICSSLIISVISIWILSVVISLYIHLRKYWCACIKFSGLLLSIERNKREKWKKKMELNGMEWHKYQIHTSYYRDYIVGSLNHISDTLCTHIRPGHTTYK